MLSEGAQIPRSLDSDYLQNQTQLEGTGWGLLILASDNLHNNIHLGIGGRVRTENGSN